MFFPRKPWIFSGCCASTSSVALSAGASAAILESSCNYWDFQLNKWSFNGRLLWDIMGYCLANYILVFFWVLFCTVCVWKWGIQHPREGLEWPPTGKRWETSDPGAFQPAGPTIPSPTYRNGHGTNSCWVFSRVWVWFSDVLHRFQDSAALGSLSNQHFPGSAMPVQPGRGRYQEGQPHLVDMAVPELVSGAFCIFGHEITFGERRDLSKSSACHLIIFDIHVEILAFLWIFNLEPIHRIRAEFGQVLMWNCIHPSACVQAQLRPWELQPSGRGCSSPGFYPSDFQPLFQPLFHSSSGPWMMSQCSSESSDWIYRIAQRCSCGLCCPEVAAPGTEAFGCNRSRSSFWNRPPIFSRIGMLGKLNSSTVPPHASHPHHLKGFERFEVPAVRPHHLRPGSVHNHHPGVDGNGWQSMVNHQTMAGFLFFTNISG